MTPPIARIVPQRTPPRPPRTPPVITADRPSPGVPTAPAPPPVAAPAPKPAPAPPPPPVENDLASYIAARRRARDDIESQPSTGTPNAPPAESDKARRDRIVAANLASVNSQSFGNAPKNSGGIFGITRLGANDAEFTFYGWNKDINRRASQRIEVQQGTNPDIRIAVVRKMIAIIRQYEHEDFLWESPRLGRNISLSARESDNADLEAFMMREFFGTPALPR